MSYIYVMWLASLNFFKIAAKIPYVGSCMLLYAEYITMCYMHMCIDTHIHTYKHAQSIARIPIGPFTGICSSWHYTYQYRGSLSAHLSKKNQ